MFFTIFATMKATRYIAHLVLSLLILVVASYPCTDRFEYVPSVVNTINYTTATSSIDTSIQKEITLKDTCSPLCTCNCCATFITLAFSVNLPEAKTSSLNKEVVSFYNYFPQNIATSIWQPPKIA